MHCRTCKGLIEPIDLNVERGYATCPACGAMQSLAAPDVAPASVTLPRGWVGLPPGYELEELQRSARVRWRWRSWKTAKEASSLLTLPFLYQMFFVPIPGASMFLPFIGVLWVIVLYRVLCQLVNHSVLEVSRDELRVRHGPLPYARARTLPTRDIEQLFCAEQMDLRRGRRPLGYFDVRVAMKDGQGVVDLVTRLPEANQALYLEQLIERVLRIEDRAVAGEMVRPDFL
jgi:hypothetical protein